MAKIERIHSMNKKLIREKNLDVGDKLILKRDAFSFKKDSEFIIESIHPLYGWISLEESEQFPQEVKKLLTFMRKK